jgi:hypothetical protein
VVKPATGSIRLRPHAHLFRQALLSTLAFQIPVFAVLYFLTVPNGPWVAVLALHILTSVAFLIATHAYFRAAVWVDPTGIAERGFFGRLVYIPTSGIGSIVLVHTYHGGGADTLPQLFICDPSGRQIVRLRGQFWSIENMRLVGSTLGVQVTELAEAVSTRELLEQFPGLLYWFERSPLLGAVAFTGSVVVGGALLYLGLAWLGVTTPA